MFINNPVAIVAPVIPWYAEVSLVVIFLEMVHEKKFPRFSMFVSFILEEHFGRI